MPSFIERQLEFAAHIRQPEQHPRPRDVEERRMAVYRELLYNNVESFVSGTFPVLRSLLDDGPWHAMVRDFFHRHRCRSPLFLDISGEFLDYLTQEREAQQDDPAFLLELAHYEWVELAVSVNADPPHVAVDPGGDLLEGEPVLAPNAWVLSYGYPVHRISPEFRPTEPGEQPTHLLVYRDPDEEVRFTELNAVTARLLSLLDSEQPETGLAVLNRIANELKHVEPSAVIDGGAGILEDLRQRGAILGTAAHAGGSWGRPGEPA